MHPSISDDSIFTPIAFKTTDVQSETVAFASTSFESAESRTADSALYYYLKRTIDIVTVLAASVWLLPLFLVITILIKLDSSGPAFFVHERVGARRRVKDGKTMWEICKFPMFKFRSMAHNADQSLHEEHVKAYVQGDLAGSESDNATFKLTNDPRITRMGQFLRKTSLDELPQLINVFRGEMSLVGPRPVPEYEVAYYQEEHFERLTVLPGMTGLWQVEGRGDVSFNEMIDLDIRYVRSCSTYQDLKLLLQTVPAAIAGRGAQ